MAKTKSARISRNANVATSRSDKRSSLPKGAGELGQFVLGRIAFGNVSAVEGIVLSRGLEADLRRLEGVPHERRRATLASKYGKK